MVGFKTKNDAERQFIKKNLPGLPILGFIDYNADIAQTDIQGINAFESVPQAAADVRKIKDELEKLEKLM